jgi:hypothetical protein
MAETISISDYISAQFIGWAIFGIGVIVVALVSKLFKKKT